MHGYKGCLEILSLTVTIIRIPVKKLAPCAGNLYIKYNPQNETCDALRTKRAKIKTKRFSVSKRSVPLRRFPGHPFSKKFRPGFAGGWGCPGSVFEWPPNTVRRPFFFFAFSLWVAARPLYRFTLTRLRSTLCTRPRSAL